MVDPQNRSQEGRCCAREGSCAHKLADVREGGSQLGIEPCTESGDQRCRRVGAPRRVRGLGAGRGAGPSEMQRGRQQMYTAQRGAWQAPRPAGIPGATHACMASSDASISIFSCAAHSCSAAMAKDTNGPARAPAVAAAGVSPPAITHCRVASTAVRCRRRNESHDQVLCGQQPVQQQPALCKRQSAAVSRGQAAGIAGGPGTGAIRGNLGGGRAGGLGTAPDLAAVRGNSRKGRGRVWHHGA